MSLFTFFDFCSGIGGGRLGLELCGLECVGFAETSHLAVKTYKYFFEDDAEKNYGNVKKIKGSNLPSYDLFVAGFPCQSFSVIGRRDGLNDSRGQLIYDLIRLMDESRPKAFILENVRGLISHNKGDTLKFIISSIRNIGYDVIYKVISSIDHGVPQMRQRVFFVGVDSSLGIDINNFKWPQPSAKPDLNEYLVGKDNIIDNETQLKLKYYLNNPLNIGKYNLEDFANSELLIIDTRMSDLRLYKGKVPTLRSHRDGILYVKEKRIRYLTGTEALLLQGFPA